MIGRGFCAAEAGRLYGFDTCLLLFLLLRMGPTCWLSDVDSPIVLVPATLAFEPPGTVPEFGISLEAVRFACARYGDAEEEGLSAREGDPARVAGVGAMCGGCLYGRICISCW